MYPEFETHILNDRGKAHVELTREYFQDLLHDVSMLLPYGRELAIVTTKLEEACFFAIKGISKQPEDQL